MFHAAWSSCLASLLGSVLWLGSLVHSPAACQTTLDVIDLSTWSVVQYGRFTQGAANWILAESNTVAMQTENADASIFLSPFDFQSGLIQGSWRVDSLDDNDFIGIVFGFQDDRHFYLFDWKQTFQNAAGVSAEQGMTVKVITADSPLREADFYATVSANTNRVRTLYHNTIPWVDQVDYGFSLEFVSGHFTIIVREGSNILASIDVDDSTFTNGKFGFYNHSQDGARYAGFTRRVLAPTPVVSVADSSVLEGDNGTANLFFPVTLSVTNCEVTTVNYAFSPGSATAGEDYIAIGGGTLVFAPGETVQFVFLPVRGDRSNEVNETIFLTLSDPTNCIPGIMQATGTIVNDDTNGPPRVRIIDPLAGATFYTPPGVVTIQAEAYDIGGTVTRVDFFAGQQFLGSDSTPPYVIAWTNTVPGSYPLRAQAMDDEGNITVSAPVVIFFRTCDVTLTASDLTNQVRCLCDQVWFSVDATSSEPLSFLWRANGVILPGETNNYLHLQGLHPDQAGIYTVEISTPCALLTRSATLTLKGAGAVNPVGFTNSARITIQDNNSALTYPSTIEVDCIPGLLKHLTVTLDGLNHNFPDDVDVMLVSPRGQALKLMSDAGGTGANKLTNIVLSFSDTASQLLPDAARIAPGVYQNSDYPPADTFALPAPAITTNSFSPFLDTDPNGLWRLFIRDDLAGDAGFIARGWSLQIEWVAAPPTLTTPRLLPAGLFTMTLHGTPRMAHLIETSTNLSDWLPWSTHTPGPDGKEIFFEPPVPPEICRFFRAARCP